MDKKEQMYSNFINEMNNEILITFSNILKLILALKYDINLPVEMNY